ncbi:MAG: YfiR family protein [Thiothrix sp.]|nr:YfiR family protein [Thiothrix sp.]HPQ96615.1 YfiR family protein [Thiolinea sp.]
MVLKQALVMVLLWLCIVPVPLPADELDSERGYQLQAAFLYQFLKFVSWEPELPAGRFVLCVLSANHQLTRQLQTLDNRNTLWGRIQVRIYPSQPSSRQFAGCESAYIDTGFPYESLRGQMVNNQMLTVVREDLSDLQTGIFIFLIREQKLRFKVNLLEARRRGIRISASLLLLAVEVIEH